MAEITLDPKKLARHITITVHMKNWRWWNFRLRLGARIIALGAWVAGIGYEERELDSQ